MNFNWLCLELRRSLCHSVTGRVCLYVSGKFVSSGRCLNCSIQMTLKCGPSHVFALIYPMTLQSVFSLNYNYTFRIARHVFKERAKWKFLSSLITIIGSPYTCTAGLKFMLASENEKHIKTFHICHHNSIRHAVM